MKKYFFIFLTLASASAFAQEKFMVGADIGANFAKDHNTVAPNGETAIYSSTMLYGFEADYQFTESYTLRLQFFPTERNGVSHLETYDATYVIGSSHNDFLDIPLTVKYTAFGTRFQGYFFGGPVFSIHTDGSAVFKNPNFGITAGFGFFRSSNDFISYFAETGYTFGILNLSRDPSIRAYSRDIRINAGLLFTLE